MIIKQRSTQPYRSSLPRQPGAALTAMLKGRSSSGFNPKDIERAALKKKRAKRPPRTPRPQRPPR